MSAFGCNANGGEFPGETWDDSRARWAKQDETADALASARFHRGQYLTDDEKAALARDVRWGSSAYPVHKIGRSWSYEWASSPLFPTKRAAWCHWQTLLESFRALERREKIVLDRQ